ncbi:hypothetical protein [Paraburkholderia sp. RL17-337-BIB-A]|uniref:hypothetical protein n=1 Tax=Paraburkholderia sp. RL17-337-BIB-A TaxID=3031636 RepID=UPI0038B9AFBA
MTNQPKEQKHGVGRKDEDKRADDIPNSDTGSPAPDSAAPVLQSEDDEPFDEDSPELGASGRGDVPKQHVSEQRHDERT